MKYRFVGGALALTLLSGCEGLFGSGSSENAFAFDDIVEGSVAFAALTEDALDADPTDGDDLPSSGSANYEGFLAIDSSDNPTTDGVLGTIELDVDFADSSLSGSAGSFINLDNESVDGSMTISDGTILTGGDAGGTASLTGSVELAAGMATIDETVTHVFSGDEGQYNTGAVLGGGTASTDGGDVAVDIVWSTEQQ